MVQYPIHLRKHWTCYGICLQGHRNQTSYSLPGWPIIQKGTCFSHITPGFKSVSSYLEDMLQTELSFPIYNQIHYCLPLKSRMLVLQSKWRTKGNIGSGSKEQLNNNDHSGCILLWQKQSTTCNAEDRTDIWERWVHLWMNRDNKLCIQRLSEKTLHNGEHTLYLK